MRRMVERPPSKPTVFVTGATGFIGRRVVALLEDRADRQIRCLVRDHRPFTESPTISVVRGELARRDTFASSLAGVHTVLHLAARTGKGSRQDHFATNRDGTETLVNAAREAGVGRFVNVSTIATTFQHRIAYHYADAKAEGERLVRSSGLRFVNVRPTLVFGAGSSVGQGLLKIATLPVIPLFGGGNVRVQPIHVDDVADFLVAALDEEHLDNHDVDLGGAEVVSMKHLVQRIRRAAKGSDGSFFPFPGLPTMRMLAMVEPALGGFLPVNAGQLSAFVNDSDAKAIVPGAMPVTFRYTLEDMIRDTVARE